MITFSEIKNSEEIRTYIALADESLVALGFTEHSFAHVTHVAETVKYLLETLGYSEREVELGQIAGYLHDIGNLINRVDHSQSGAMMAFRILKDMGAQPEDIATIVTAIGNHFHCHIIFQEHTFYRSFIFIFTPLVEPGHSIIKMSRMRKTCFISCFNIFKFSLCMRNGCQEAF